MPRGARTAHLPQAGLGTLPAGQRPVRGRHRGGAPRALGAGLHTGLPPRARRGAAATPPAGGEDGHLLAHPMAESRPAPHLPLASRVDGGSARQRSHRLSARTGSPQLPDRGSRGRLGGDAQHRPHGEPDRGGQGRADRRRLRPHPADHARCRPRRGAGAPAAGTRARHPADRDRGRPSRLHERRSGAPRRAGAAAGAAQRRARPVDVRAGRRPLAVQSAQLRRRRRGDRPQGGRHQRAARIRAGDPLPEVVVPDQASRGALPPREFLHRQLAARRHEPGRQGVRRGAGGRGRGAGPERDGGRRAAAPRRAAHQPLRHRGLHLGDRAGDRHAARRAPPADACDAAHRRRTQHLRVGVRHPRRARAAQPAGAAPRRRAFAPPSESG